MKTVDLTKELKPLYTATRKIEEVVAERSVFLAVDGHGEPGGEAFQGAIGSIFATAYTLKFALKKEGRLDFKIPKLETLWLSDPATVKRSDWKWRALLRIPDEVTGSDLKTVRRLLADKGHDVSGVRRVSWREGRALQVMHVGPYEKLGDTYRSVFGEAENRGYRVKGSCHEVYLSDPRRTAPENLKTIVRVPISHPRPRQARG
jgi:hypothetical protein